MGVEERRVSRLFMEKDYIVILQVPHLELLGFTKEFFSDFVVSDGL